MNRSLAAFYLLFGAMILIFFWGLLIPMPPLLLGFLMVLVICLGLFLLSIILNVLLIRGAVLPSQWRRRLQALQRWGWTIWIIRAVMYSGVFWFCLHEAYEAAILVAMLMLPIFFARPLIRHHLAKWS